MEMIARADQTSFKIASDLPDGGSGPQYKIKCGRASCERGASEWGLPVRLR
jgi:hypothetical protein